MRTRKQPFVLSVLAVLALSAGAAAQVPVDDHFDTAMGPEWVIERGGAQVVDGWLVLSRTDVGFPRRDSCVSIRDGDPSIRDFVLHFRADPDISFGTWERSHVAFRTTDPWGASGTGYSMNLVFPGDGSGSRATLVRTVNGVGVEIAPRVTPFAPTQPVDVVVRAIGHSIQIYLNGSLLFDVDDPAGPLAGGVHFWSVWESSGRYDDVTLTLLPPLCAGDADGNGVVEFSDIAQVLASFGTMCP